MSNVKLDSSGLETPMIKIGESQLTSSDEGKLIWNDEIIEKPDLSGYAKKSDLSGYAKKSDLNSYATTSSLSSYIKTSTLKSYVTETWQNGTSWYRKYSDGWIIQTGTIATTAGDRDTSTITLPTAFTSATYYANVMLENVNMDGGGGMWTVKSKTTTSFIIHNGQDSTGTFRWFACGY